MTAPSWNEIFSNISGWGGGAQFSLPHIHHLFSVGLASGWGWGGGGPRGTFSPWMKEAKDKTLSVGVLPTLPSLYFSKFQPWQRGFFRVHTSG